MHKIHSLSWKKISTQGKTNFFEERPTEYGKAGMEAGEKQ